MIKDGNILLGKTEGGKEVYLYPATLNRHGLVAGATGTGKTVTLKVIAEGLSQLGVPTVIADVKGDLSGMIETGDLEKISGRLEKLGISGFDTRTFPVHFFDVYGKQGHPVRATIQGMGPVLLGRIMDVTDAQLGVLSIIFKVAREMELDLIDLKDLQAMTAYVGEHAKEFTIKYGNVSTQSIGGIQRKLLQLEEQGADQFFGMPDLKIEDWMRTEGGMGMMNIIECQQLFQQPLLYATFLYWMLHELYEKLPEAGDLDRPKIVFFFDEAHILFNKAPKELLTQIQQTVKLIRSKGVGVFFVTQNPTDIPAEVLSQLGSRVLHSLRAYTPAEIKGVKMAADAFRANPEFDTAEVLTAMKTGEALVSVLAPDGAPTVVEKAMILPPQSSMNIAGDGAVERSIRSDALYGKYETAYDPESAYEAMEDIHAQEEQERQAEAEAKKQAKIDEAKAKEEARAQARKEKEQKEWGDRLARKARNKLENEAVNFGMKQAKHFLNGFFKK